jgi:hypothetical protein
MRIYPKDIAPILFVMFLIAGLTTYPFHTIVVLVFLYGIFGNGGKM